MTRRKPPEPKVGKKERREAKPRERTASVREEARSSVPIPLYSRIAGDQALSLEHTEWVLTNSLGGFAMGTALGMPTRRYHALLVTDSNASPQRQATLSHVVERVLIRTPGGADEVIDLSTFRFAGGNGSGDSDSAGGNSGGVIHPRGDSRLVRFEKDVACRWVFHAGPIEIVKELLLVKNTRAGMLRYQVKARRSAIADVRLEVLPLVSLRDYHGLRRRGDGTFHTELSSGGNASIRVQSGDAAFSITADRGDVNASGSGCGWWDRFLYRIEAERGQDHLEDLFCPGVFGAELSARQKPDSLVIRFGSDERELASLDSFDAEMERLRKQADDLIATSFERCATIGEEDAEPLAALALAADDFVVHPRHPNTMATRDIPPTSIIAGYPWFTDWGRDTMISLPGLLLESGRFGEALAALRRFADARRNGIIPNRFTDVGAAHATDHGATGAGEPEYNTIDASLWYIVAACRYLEASGDRAGFEKHLLPACVEVIDAYRRGTEFGIAMDPADFLIAGGSAATQLTWMDARRDGVCFTPRHGKAVEINALWHASLCLLAEAAHPEQASNGAAHMKTDSSPFAADLRALADSVAHSFRATFYSDALGCCFDAVTPDGNGRWQPSSEIRPNQIFAVSLPHSPLSAEQQRNVVRVVRERLLTPFGVRTLAPGSRGYAARFRGGLHQLDAAYHNGTAWPWLLGAYAEAVARVDDFSPAAIREARQSLRGIVRKLDSECVGSIAEVFDAEGTPGAPQRSGGCPAQAWSVAEVRRVLGLLARREAELAK